MSNEWHSEPWQPTNKKVLPAVMLLTDTWYNIESPYVKFHQVRYIDQLVNIFGPKKEKVITGNTPLKLNM
ncbi:MAG: hypothetical protein ABF649_22865 [Bacillus sp. (in: firmicutes)]